MQKTSKVTIHKAIEALITVGDATILAKKLPFLSFDKVAKYIQV